MLTIIRGLPGSGKSTLARLFEEQGHVRIEKDLLRVNEQGEYVYDASQNPKLEARCLWLTEYYLVRGDCVVVSNTNELLFCVEQYIAIAERLRVCWTVIETKGRWPSCFGDDELVGIDRRAKAWEHFPVR